MYRYLTNFEFVFNFFVAYENTIYMYKDIFFFDNFQIKQLGKKNLRNSCIDLNHIESKQRKVVLIKRVLFY